MVLIDALARNKVNVRLLQGYTLHPRQYSDRNRYHNHDNDKEPYGPIDPPPKPVGKGKERQGERDLGHRDGNDHQA